ncbi:MAG: polysaccharide deacetylase family protein [Candidatus Heimdallarchaeota archaeon]|nr:MAG: polysaccharide deacetylase family protein [Candidatus Heimdallarchaeota archaeon]
MVNLNRLTSWTRHLRTRRGNRIFLQAVKMFKFHMTPFSILLQRICEVLEEYDSKFTFPLTASTAQSNPILVKWLKSSHHEIAIHGYKHVRYPFLSTKHQFLEIKKSIQVFKELRIPFQGFRAPYNLYSETTKELINKFGFKWDAGIGFHRDYRNGHKFFKIRLKDGKESSYTCIPLCEWSDDRMIDNYNLSSEKMAKILIYHLEKARKVNGLIMYDLHPIRIGQNQYIQSLRRLLIHANKIDAWIPTISEAINYWSKHHQWKDSAPVCCLLTGDIDNFTFFDYIRRI